jgi:mannosyl-oligosaccharide alpha-1,2-mannosidase
MRCFSYQGCSRTGIGPEIFAYISADGNFTGYKRPSKDQLAFYNKNGYYIIASDYVQRPEVLESNFYAWRVTGNTTYLQRARSAVASFSKYLYTPTGFVGLRDVDNPASTKINKTESFWFAEVLKYL